MLLLRVCETGREADRQTRTGTDRERLGHTQRQTDGPSEADLTTTTTTTTTKTFSLEGL